MCHTYILQVYCVSMTSASSSLLIKLNRLRRARLKLIKNLQIGFLITLICALLNLENIEILYNLVHHVFHLSLRIYHQYVFWKAVPFDRESRIRRDTGHFCFLPRSSKYFSLPLSYCEHGIILLMYLLLIRISFN